MKKSLIGMLALSIAAHAAATDCQLWRGQAWLYPYPLDGTFTLNDNAALYAYAINDDGTQTFTFGTFLAADTQTLTLAPDNVIWYSIESAYPNCQFSLGYNVPPRMIPAKAAVKKMQPTKLKRAKP